LASLLDFEPHANAIAAEVRRSEQARMRFMSNDSYWLMPVTLTFTE
jgi:hypothetical protein